MFRLAVKNMLRSGLRTLLTLLGLSVTMGLIVLLSSVRQHYTIQLENSLARDDVAIVVQAKHSATPFSSRIMQEEIERIKAMEGVKSVSSLIVASRQVGNSPSLVLFGTSSLQPIADRIGFALLAGRPFRPGAKELVIGQKAAAKLDVTIGDKLEITHHGSFTVTGLYSLGVYFLDGGAFIDLSVAQVILDREKAVNLAFISLHDSEDVERVTGSINHRFPHLMAVPTGELTRIVGPVSMIETLVVIISVVAIGVSVIIILNTLFMAVTERTKEIGILMTIGWSPKMIASLILTESLLLAGIGSLTGFLLVYPALDLINSLQGIGPSWLPDSPNINLLPEVLLLAALIGVLSASYPTYVAVRLSPAAALRHEH